MEKTTRKMNHLDDNRDGEKTKKTTLPPPNNANKKITEDAFRAYLKLFEADEELAANFNDLTVKEQRELLYSTVCKLFPSLVPHLTKMLVASFYDGDCGRNPGDKPEWLDMGKFRRGQQLLRDNFFGYKYSELLSLFVLFSFQDSLQPMILTGMSDTPYTSFRRYLSSAKRIRNWCSEDPWEKGTAAYKDIQTVRKIHSLVRNKTHELSKEDINIAATMENPWCPARNYMLQDLQATCPAPAPNQCPYNLCYQSLPSNMKHLNQSEMTLTLFGFIGLIVLYPEAFGMHNASDEDLYAICHVWRGIGYLLGIEDEFNICQGTLEEVKQRLADFLDMWVKPNFREITPEWEHMMRCVIAGLQYYFPGSKYEVSFLYLAEIMGLHMPRLKNSLTYMEWFEYKLSKFLFYYVIRVPGLRSWLNKRLNDKIDEALKFDEKHHEQLKIRSDETLLNFAQL